MKISPPTIETVAIDRLKEWARNPRTNHAVDAIAKSIEAFGYLSPIVVQKGSYRILAGHGRLKALRAQGVTEIPVVVANVNDRQANLYTIADNKLQEIAEWDFAQLASILKELQEQDDVALAGFQADEIKRISSWLPENQGEESEPVPSVLEQATSRLGDLWELGNHRLLCGDSTEAEDVARLMDGVKAALMNTDPPYGIAYDSKALHVNDTNYEPIEGDALDGEKLQQFLEAAIRAAVPHLIESAAFYLWHPMLTQGTFFAAAAAADILISRQIIWVKPQMIFGRGHYHWKHELCFYGWRRGHQPEFFGQRNQVTVWDIAYDGNRNERDHPTQKPVELFTRPMENHTKQGDAVYEPFAGSGSQFIAAEKLGRRCFGLEIEPRYCDVIVKRWQNFTGKMASNLTRPKVTL